MNPCTVLAKASACWVVLVTHAAPPASADLIFDTGTTQVLNGGDDVNPASITLPTAFHYFGTSYTNLWTTSNGVFAFSNGGGAPVTGTNYGSSTWYNAGFPVLAPMWNDSNNSPAGASPVGNWGGVSKIGATTYANSYSVTVPNTFFYGSGWTNVADAGFQVSLFTGAETVTKAAGKQFSFLSRDIAISYAWRQGPDSTTAFAGDACMGVASGGLHADLPGAADGNLTSANQALIPTGDSFLLFRWNPTAGNYDASIQSFCAAPQISITNPTEGATFIDGSNITIEADASDTDGAVTLVEFYQGATKLGEDAANPFSLTWNNVATGNYSLTAVAHDNDGRTTVSAPVGITVGTPNLVPTAGITNPANNATFHAPATVTIEATASDTDGTIAKVEFYQGATKLGEDTEEPYGFTWSNVVPGRYTLMARAIDDDGAPGDSTLVNITVNGLIFDMGATLLQGGGDDQNPVDVTLPFAFNLFGTAVSSIRVGSNGAFGVAGGLNGGQYDSTQSPWHNTGAGKPILAPLWDDLNTSPNGSGSAAGIHGGVSQLGATTYPNSYSFTAMAAFTYGTGHAFTSEISFQVSLFSGPETVVRSDGKAFSFQADDIAFSYANNSITAFTNGSAAVGLTDGAGTAVGMPGTTDGVLSTTDRALLPTGDSFLLFRSNGAGGYTATIAQFGAGLTPREQWRQRYFGSPANSGNGADDFDYDHDGYVNLLEYALGLDPTLPSPPLAGQWVADGGHSYLTIVFTRPTGRDDVSVGGEICSDLAGPWSADPADVGIAITDNGNGTETVKIWDKIPLDAGQPKHFLRVTATP